MRALHIKLVRDVVRLRAQVLAIALVMAAGVTTLILSVGAYDSLSQTRASYYAANNFADVFASVTRAPKELVPEIEAIEGVSAVEPRIVKIALVDIEGMAEPAFAMLVSLPDLHPPHVNQLHIRSGRLPEAGNADEALVSEAFAKAHALEPGSTIRTLINGRQRDVVVTGVALSPEFIYTIGPGDLLPDDRRFGIMWMPERTLAPAFDLNGAFSSVVLTLLPGASESAVIEQLDALLAPYGGQGAYGRSNQTSHAFLDAELTELGAMSRVLPPIFLLVAAYLVNMTLSRLVALEREQIGLLKALGYSSWAIARHYIEFVSLIAAIGIFLGIVAGVWLGGELTTLYARFFNFPFLVFSRNPAIYVIATVATLAAAVLGAARAVAGVAWLPPAVAMSPPLPARYTRLWGGVAERLLPLSQSAVMISRHLLHWPWRTGSGILGMSMAAAILVGSLWSFGSIEYMIDVTFYRADRQDASISFASPRPIAALYSAARLPGVLRAEPYRAVALVIRHNNHERRIALLGRSPAAQLSRVLDQHLAPVALPGTGIVISTALAKIMDLTVGDTAQLDLLEGDRRTLRVPVSAVVEGFLGLTAYMDIDALNRLLNEGAMISGVNVSFDPLAQDQLFAALKSTPDAGFIALQKVALEKFRSTLAQNILVMITVYVALAAIIAFGVVYNFARISLSEQGRELASLRVLGFTRGEVSLLLISELAIVALIAQPIGWLIGYMFAWAMTKAFDSELYRVPFIIGPDVYAYASITVLLATLASALLVRRRIDRLDMIAVLKTRE